MISIKDLGLKAKRASSNLHNVTDKEIVNAVGEYLNTVINTEVQPMELVDNVEPVDIKFCNVRYHLPLEASATNIPNTQDLNYRLDKYLKKTVHDFIEFKDDFCATWTNFTADPSEFRARARKKRIALDSRWLSINAYTFQDKYDVVNAFYVEAKITNLTSGIVTSLVIKEAEKTISTGTTDNLTMFLDFENKIIRVHSGQTEYYKVELFSLEHFEPLILATPDEKLFVSAFSQNRENFVNNVIIKARLRPRLPYSVDDYLPSYLDKYLKMIVYGTAKILEQDRNGSVDPSTIEQYNQVLREYVRASRQKLQFERNTEYQNSTFAVDQESIGGLYGGYNARY